MNNKTLQFLKILFLSILSLIIVFVLAIYLFLVFFLPNILKNPEVIKNIENYLSKKTNAECVIEKPNIDVSFLLDLDFTLDNFSLKNQTESILDFNNIQIHYDIKGNNFVNIKNSYIDMDKMSLLFPKKKTNKKTSFNLDKIPNLDIKNLKIDSKKNVKLHFEIKNFKIIKEEQNRKDIFFDGNVLLPKPLKTIIISSSKNLYIKDGILSATDFKINFSKNQIILNGDIFSPNKKPNLHILSNKMNSQDVVDVALFLQNIKNKQKKFLQNFRNFSGELSFDVRLRDNILNGVIFGNNVKAYTTLFNLPVLCPKTTITIKNNTMEGVSSGVVGGEKIVHTLKITNLLTSSERTVEGKVESQVTHKLAKKYLPKQYNIQGKSNVTIDYHIKNKKINVKYYVDFPVGSDFYYNNFNLGLKNKNRRFFIHTYKTGNDMYLKEYNYSYIDNKKTKNIIFGDGLFKRINNKFKPQYLTVKTNGYAPVSLIGGFGKYVWGGQFSGNLNYDFNKLKLTGNFSVIDTYFNHFNVKNANVSADDKDLLIEARGTYRGEIFTSKMHAKNNLFEEDRMKVYSLDLFLDKFKIAKSNPNTGNKKEIDISHYVRKILMDVYNYNIQINSIVLNRAIASNIKIKGSINNSLFKFDISNIDFAKGKLLANGLYNFNNDSSHIVFVAKNIDSDIVADSIFDMKNYITGVASADFSINTYDKLEIIDGLFKFNIDGGYLPKLGDIEFMVDKNNKNFFKPQDYTNVDLSKAEKLKSDISCLFKLHNQHFYDINLTSKQEALGLFIEGEYNKDIEHVDMSLFGKYDKNSTKNVKIIHIPLKWILNILFIKKESKGDYLNKLKKIPNLDISSTREQFFMIKIKGDLNNQDNLDYKMRSLR